MRVGDGGSKAITGQQNTDMKRWPHYTTSIRNLLYIKKMRPYHIWPLGACRDTWLLYWKAGCSLDNTGSWKDLLHWLRSRRSILRDQLGKLKVGRCRVLTRPTTPRPRTVSRVPERLKILQCLSLSWTTSLPMFSRRMQYRHWGGIRKHLANKLSLYKNPAAAGENDILDLWNNWLLTQ